MPNGLNMNSSNGNVTQWHGNYTPPSTGTSTEQEPEQHIKFTLHQAPVTNTWAVSSIIIDINGSQQTPIELNKLGKTEFQIPLNIFNTGNNTIKIANYSGVEGEIKDNGDGNSWDLFEIALEDYLGNNIPITNLRDDDNHHSWQQNLSSYPIVSKLIDNNTSTYWSYSPSIIDLTETNGNDVSGIQWFEFDIILTE